MPASPDDSAEGFVYAATGEAYVTLARRSARALRLVQPGAKIDLFTDRPLEDPVFDTVHLLKRSSRRPKMEALRRTRFARTQYLDADIIPLAPLAPLFPLLDRFDIGAAIDERHNDWRNRSQIEGWEVPETFPALNSGVVLVRASPETADFLTEWERRVHDGTQKFDQPMFRALLFHGRLRLAILPSEWNVMWVGAHLARGRNFPAPRLLHLPRLHHNPPGDPTRPLTASGALPPAQRRRLAEMIAADASFGAAPDQGTDSYRARHRLHRFVRWIRTRLRGSI